MSQNCLKIDSILSQNCPKMPSGKEAVVLGVTRGGYGEWKETVIGGMWELAGVVVVVIMIAFVFVLWSLPE